MNLNLAGTNAQSGWAAAEKSPTLGYIWISSFPECEGKDAGSYTRVATDSSSVVCSSHSQDAGGPLYLIANSEPHSGKKEVIGLQQLVASGNLPAGCKTQIDDAKIYF